MGRTFRPARPCPVRRMATGLAALAYAALLPATATAESSPLSIHREGFGIAVSPHSVREKAMGEAGIASITKQGLSIANASRTAFHDKTSFSALADGDIDWLQDDLTSNRSTTFLIPAVSLNFSLKRFGHLALYYRQRFHRNYNLTLLEPERADAVQAFTAEGGLYEAAVTYAFAPIPSLALGVGFHYSMGRERLIESATFTDDPDSPDLYNGENLTGDTLISRSSGGNPSLSVTYRRPTFSVALAGALGTELEVKTHRSITNLIADQKSSATKDLPWTLAAGVAYKPVPNQTVVADFAWEAWDDADSDLLNPAFRLGGGYEFQGRGGQYEPYFRKLAFRGGIGLEREYLDESNLYFLTMGLGMPLGRRGSLLDFAFKYGHRSVEKNNLWTEDYLKLSVALTGVGSWGQPVRKRR